MILEIATIRIKIRFGPAYNLDTEYIKKILEMYTAKDNSDKYDFELKTVKYTEPLSKKYEMELRNDALYYETEDTFFFETESWSSTIYWKKKLMRTMFVNEKSTETHDALLIRSLKLLVSLLVLKKGGLPFHCSAVSDKNRYSILFSGESTAGKTIIALLMYHKFKMDIFNDEFNIIMPSNGSYYVHSTPFTSSEKINFCSYGKAPIKKIFFIKKDMYNRTEEIALPQKYFYVLSGTYTFPTSEYFGILLMETAEKIARSISMKTLNINHKSINADKIDELINQEEYQKNG